MNGDKKQVHDFWNRASCGEDLFLDGTDAAGYEAQAKARYELEGKMIFPLAGSPDFPLKNQRHE